MTEILVPLAAAVTAFVVLLLVQYPTAQRVVMGCALLLAIALVGLDQQAATPVIRDEFCYPLAIAAFLLLSFAAWNLFTRRGGRWAYRVVIYTVYAASFQLVYIVTLILTPSLDKARIMPALIISGVTYIVASLFIVTLKPWFARRMMREIGDEN